MPGPADHLSLPHAGSMVEPPPDLPFFAWYSGGGFGVLTNHRPLWSLCSSRIPDNRLAGDFSLLRKNPAIRWQLHCDVAKTMTVKGLCAVAPSQRNYR